MALGAGEEVAEGNSFLVVLDRMARSEAARPSGQSKICIAQRLGEGVEERVAIFQRERTALMEALGEVPTFLLSEAVRTVVQEGKVQITMGSTGEEVATGEGR